ncbi:MAG: ABC transporter permease [Anaerolineae bacterium]|nr:ABC transporter permease [Anaerolineae bacterium]
MLRYLIRRLFLLVITMLVTSLLIFALTQLLPGDTARLILGREASEQAIANLREEFGLNDPIPQQYVNWLSRFVQGDWGRSFSSDNQEVLPLVGERLGNTLRLGLMTLVLSIPLSILLGIIAALRENTWIDSSISVLSLSVVGLPEFVTGLVLINIFALQLGWLPATATIPTEGTFGDWIRILLLPSITATFVLLGYVSRMARAGVIDEIKKPYVRTATLKGLPRRQIIFKHVLRNALLPTITVIALSVGWLIGGLVVIENVFNYRGLGALLVEAVKQKNLPVIQAVVMIIIFFFAIANLTADILYAVLNPRIRLQ